MSAPSGLPGFKLKHLFTLKCAVGEPMVIGNNGMGSERRVIPITGGTFEGADIRGTVLNLGFDALLMQDDMTARPDAKYCLKTDQGEVILVHSEGMRYPPGITTEKGEAAKKIAGEVDVSKYTFVLRLRLETGSARLAYLNKALIIGSALRTSDSVSYDAYIVKQTRDAKL